MLATTIKALDVLAQAALESEEWDEMPMLFVLNGEGEPEGIVSLAGNPGEILPMVAESLRKTEFVGGVSGIILQVEAYSLSSKAVDNLELVRAQLAISGKRFSDHPAAVEIKTLWAVDAEGIEARIIERGNSSFVEPPKGTLSGSIPAALKVTLAELQHGH
jgi:hypothetical protein